MIMQEDSVDDGGSANSAQEQQQGVCDLEIAGPAAEGGSAHEGGGEGDEGGGRAGSGGLGGEEDGRDLRRKQRRERRQLRGRVGGE